MPVLLAIAAALVLFESLSAAAAPDQVTLRCGTFSSAETGLVWFIAGRSIQGDVLRCSATCTIPLQDGQKAVKTCRFVITDAADRALCAGSIAPSNGAAMLNGWSCVSDRPGDWPRPPE
jgi:hypothetical protein